MACTQCVQWISLYLLSTPSPKYTTLCDISRRILTFGNAYRLIGSVFLLLPTRARPTTKSVAPINLSFSQTFCIHPIFPLRLPFFQ